MEEGTGQKRRGREGRNDDKGMGGGLDDGVMCCFRANCFCDSVTTSFNAIGYNKELIEAWANEAACHAGCEWVVLFLCFFLFSFISENDNKTNVFD